MEDMKIDIYEGHKAIDDLADQWSTLAMASWWPIYSCPEWYMAWWDTFGHEARLEVITARANGQLVGILPICRRRTNRHGLFFEIKEPLSGAMSDYHCPLVAQGWESKAFLPMLEKAWKALGRVDTLIWPNLPVTHPATQALRDFIDHSRYRSIEQKDVCPRLSFERDYSSTESLWGKKHKNDVRRQRKRLAEIGEVRLWVASSKEEMNGFLPELFRIHTDKWQSQGFPGKLNKPQLQKYLYNMVEHLWNKGLHISALMCGGERVSYHFGFLSNGWLLWYMPTYRPQYHNLSPSKVHVSYLIEEGIGAGWNGIDFLIGAEPYKYLWATESLEILTFVIGQKHMTPSYFWFSTGKTFVKRRFGAAYSNLSAILERYRK